MKSNFKKAAVLITLILAVFSLGVFLYNFCFFEYTNQAKIIIDKTDIISEISGRAVELNIEENAEVKEGEILVQFEASEYTDKIAELEKKLENIQAKTKDNKALKDKLILARKEEKDAKMKLEEANSDYVRYKNAFKDGSVTKKDLDKAVKNLETAKNKYIFAQNNLKSEENKLAGGENSKNIEINKLTSELDELKQKTAKTTIIAPVSGIIKNKNIEAGNNVEINTKLFTIVGKDAYISAEFSENQISKIKPEQTAKIKIGNKKSDGIVVSKDNSEVKIKIISDNFDFDDNSDIKVRVKVR